MLLSGLVLTSRRVAGARGRKEKVARLAECIAALAPHEVPVAIPMLGGDLRQGRLGIGYASLEPVRDAPAAAAPGLTLAELDTALGELKRITGVGAAKRRADRLGALMSCCTAPEQDFLVRLLLGELRQGALHSLVLDAVALAADVPAELVRRAHMLAADSGRVAAAALERGESGLLEFDLTLFHPVQPMLAHTADSLDDVFARFSPAALELKLDGARIQVHKSGDDVRIFSRALNDVTHAVPEIVEAVAAFPVRELVLDGETLALMEDGTPHPFQTTMRRFGRKLDVETLRAQLPLSMFFFDCLYVDGASLIDAPGMERARALADTIPAERVVPRIVTGSRDEAARFLARAVGDGHEGVMAKTLDAAYEAGNRGAGWLKLKQVHTADLVVLAVEWGSGRRAGWLSNLHLGARDADTGDFVMLGKTFKGMTDRMLAWQTEKLLSLELGREGHVVHVKPELVVEVAFNDVQTSPQYPAGLALRFARVKRYRDDKSALEADTIEMVRALHSKGAR